MSKAVLISIQPKWCELIASGKKTVEVRKSRPKLSTPFKCYIYCTKNKWQHLVQMPDKSYRIYNGKEYGKYDKSLIFGGEANGKVIGEFICNKITDLRDMGGSEFFSKSCMTYDDWRNYTNYTNHIILAWHISDLVIYDKPKKMSNFISSTDCKTRIAKDLLCNTCCLSADFCSKKPKRITRPPQSWCYVEELKL